MEDRKTTSSLPKQENTHAATKADRYLLSSLNPPNRRSRYIPQDIKFGKHRSIRITFVQMSNLAQSANRRCAENEGRCRGTFLSVGVPRAEAVKNWSDESAFSLTRCGRKGLVCTETCRGLYGYCTVGDS
jgi:hypothetical protein